MTDKPKDEINVQYIKEVSGPLMIGFQKHEYRAPPIESLDTIEGLQEEIELTGFRFIGGRT